MPLPMVHLCIAKTMLGIGFRPSNLSQFYLGSISPDAIHIRKESDKLTKNKTHLLPHGDKRADIGECDYFDFVEKFVDSNRERTDMDFILGYCTHVLTDMYWAQGVYTKFVDDYKKDAAPIQEQRWAYYNDTDILDQILFNDSDWRTDIWQHLQSADGVDFLDLLSGHEINAWKERTLHWYDSGESQHKNPIKYITKADILEFIALCPEWIMKCKIFSL